METVFRRVRHVPFLSWCAWGLALLCAAAAAVRFTIAGPAPLGPDRVADVLVLAVVAIALAPMAIRLAVPSHAFLEGHAEILRAIASDEPLEEVLASIARAIEGMGHGVRNSILVLDATETPRCLRFGAAPSLPPSFAQRVNGMAIGPEVGCCGTASFHGQRVIVDDTHTSPLWANLREVAEEFDVRGCWSQPVHSSRGEVLGCVTTYYRVPRTPSPNEIAVVESATDLIALAIERQRAADAYRTYVENLAQRNVELDRARRSAEELQRQAEQAAESKSAFLANMSHEIRTPMTAILGFADMLDDSSLEESDRKQYLATIRRSGEHLLAIISDILDLSKIEAGRMTIERIAMSPSQVVAEVCAMMRERAEGQGLSFETSFRGPVPLSIHSDPVRIRQILINLVGNAIKFTENGRVCVRVRMATASDAAEPMIAFEVEDTGIGISDVDLPRLFQPFTQADGSMTRRFGGTGLGLSISRRLAQMLGGDLAATSSLGRGSTFVATVRTGPLNDVPLVDGSGLAAARLSKGAPRSIRLSGRVLLAEDGRDNQRLIAFHLRQAGAEVEIVENGRLAVERALHAGRGRRFADSSDGFDLILMDMQMPEMDGFQATTALRRRGFDGPIIALTAHTMPEDRERCLAAGCSDYATKPIEKDQFLETCRKWLADENRLAA